MFCRHVDTARVDVHLEWRGDVDSYEDRGVVGANEVGHSVVVAWSPVRISSDFPDARSHRLRRVGRSSGKVSEPKLDITKEQITVSRKWTHRTVWSTEPDTMVLPSGLMATLYTVPVCPSNVLLTSPDARSHTLARVGGSCDKVSGPKLVIASRKQIAVSKKRLTTRCCRWSPTRWSCHRG